MLTNDLVPCFVQTFKTDSKTDYEKALLVGVFDKTTTDLDCLPLSTVLYSDDENDTDSVIQFTKDELVKRWNFRSDNDYR